VVARQFSGRPHGPGRLTTEDTAARASGEAPRSIVRLSLICRGAQVRPRLGRCAVRAAIEDVRGLLDLTERDLVSLAFDLHAMLALRQSAREDRSLGLADRLKVHLLVAAGRPYEDAFSQR
jgi:hypothetical protein